MKYILYSYYSRDLSQKVKAAVNVRMKRGEFVGSYAPYGYMKNPDNKHHLVPDPETAPVVRQIFDLAIEGRNTGEIAKFLNTRGYETPSQYFHRRFPESKKFRKTSREGCWDTSNVRMILSRLDYTGMLVCQRKNWKGVDHPRITDRDRSEWIVTPNCHEAIVSDAEFELANEVVRMRKKAEYVPRSYTLKSLIRCGECGRVMRRKTNVPHIHFYCDKSKHSVSTTCPLGEKFYEDELETVIVQDLRRMLALLVGEMELMREDARKTKGSVANLKQNLMKVEKSIKQNHLSVVESYERYSDGKIGREDFLIIKERLVVEQDVVDARLINDAIDRLNDTGAKALGCVFNDVHTGFFARAGTYGSYYGYGRPYGYGRYGYGRYRYGHYAYGHYGDPPGRRGGGETDTAQTDRRGS